MKEAPNTVNVVLLAYDGVDELDLFGAYSVLMKASDIEPANASQPALNVRLASSSEHVLGSSGVAFRATTGLDVVSSADVVVVPGGRGARNAADDGAIRDALLRVLQRGGTLYGVCTGALIVAATGRAEGRRLAIHRNKREALLDFPVSQVCSGLVRDGQIVTVGGDLSPSVKSVDLAFQVLFDVAPHAVDVIAARMEIIPGRREGSAALSPPSPAVVP